VLKEGLAITSMSACLMNQSFPQRMVAANQVLISLIQSLEQGLPGDTGMLTFFATIAPHAGEDQVPDAVHAESR
jgi:hypothetical protein